MSWPCIEEENKQVRTHAHGKEARSQDRCNGCLTLGLNAKRVPVRPCTLSLEGSSASQNTFTEAYRMLACPTEHSSFWVACGIENDIILFWPPVAPG